MFGGLQSGEAAQATLTFPLVTKLPKRQGPPRGAVLVFSAPLPGTRPILIVPETVVVMSTRLRRGTTPAPPAPRKGVQGAVATGSGPANSSGSICQRSRDETVHLVR